MHRRKRDVYETMKRPELFEHAWKTASTVYGVRANYETANEERESSNAIYRLPASLQVIATPYRFYSLSLSPSLSLSLSLSLSSISLRFASLVAEIHRITYSTAIYDIPEPCELANV